MRCSACQTDNDERARFCMHCGATLSTPQSKAPAERRQITVLFCDLVGSTALSEELDPEDLRDVIRRYHTACEAVVDRYGGSIAQLLGDGVLVYFGHPHAHEDDALRAVRAGLDLRRVVSDLRVGARPLAVRVGIHTGVVVVGALGAEARQLALGATPNLAARIQQEAQPGTVLISEVTHRLVEGIFEAIDLGARSLRGVGQALRLYRVESYTGAHSRLEATAEAALTPFVGRDAEVALVTARWADALAGKAPVLTLCGEPGIGKSRIVRKLRETVGADALITECYASPLFQGTALHPVVEMLGRLVGSESQDHESRREKLREQLERTSVATTEMLGPLETLLSIPPRDPEQSANLSPQKQRQATFDALAAWLRAAMETQPVLFVFEDLHWADPSTLELVGLLIERIGSGRLMLVLTHRPELALPFASPRITQLALQRLPREEASRILAAVAKDKMLPPSVEREVLAKADGIPLYVEEIGKAVVESESRATDDVPLSSRSGFSIPSSVADSLTARIDRLGEGKRVLQVAATVGRTFALGVLLDVAGLQEAALRAEMSRLQAAGLVLPLDAPEESYIFKHALIQDAAYGSLLRGTRQEYHRQIATALEAKFPALASSQPELFARHFEGAEMAPQAVGHWALAGQKALGRSANVEAAGAFGNALRLLATLPASEERDRQEIGLRSGLGLALISTKGWSTKDVEDTYEPAYEISRRYGNLPVGILYGVHAVYVVRADRKRVAELNQSFDRITRQSQDPHELFVAHGVLGGCAFWTADYPGVRRHSDESSKYLDRANPRRQALQLLSEGYDGQLYPLIFRAWAAIQQGQAREAASTSQAAIDVATASDHPYTLAVALGYGSAVAHDAGDVDETERRAERLRSVAIENGFPFFASNALSFLGWAAAKRGETDRGIEMMQQAAQLYRAIGTDLILAYYLGYIAEGCAIAGRIEEGLGAIDEGLRLTETKLAVFAEPDLRRLRGELLAAQGNASEAEASLRMARGLAERSGALLQEARASLSLARFWRAQGRAAEAGDMLRTMLQRFPSDEPLAERQQLADLEKDLGAGARA